MPVSRRLIEGHPVTTLHKPEIKQLLAARQVAYEGALLGDSKAPNREELAWAVHYDDAETLNAANAFLSKWKKEGKLQSLIKKWIPYARW